MTLYYYSQYFQYSRLELQRSRWDVPQSYIDVKLPLSARCTFEGVNPVIML
jgi:hypothetical protein